MPQSSYTFLGFFDFGAPSIITPTISSTAFLNFFHLVCHTTNPRIAVMSSLEARAGFESKERETHTKLVLNSS